MLNIIRADIYRLVRSKSIYITAGVLIIYVSLLVFTEGTIGVAANIAVKAEDAVVENAGLSTLTKLLESTNNLIYFLLPIFLSVSATMFSCGTVKNDIASGISRTKLYFSKLILCSILCAAIMILYVFSGFLFIAIFQGFQDSLTWKNTLDILKITGAQVIFLLAFTSIGVFLSFATRRSAVVNGAYIAFSTLPVVIITIISDANKKFLELLKYDLVGCIQSLTKIDILPDTDILRIFTIGVVYIFVSTLGGLLLFRRAEIK